MQFFFYIIFVVLIKYILPTFHCRYQPSYKISCKHLNLRLNYNNFFLKFKTAAGRYLGFSITWFWAIGRLGLRFSIIVPNLVQKMLIDTEIMAQNRNPRWRPSAILDLIFLQIWLEMPIHAPQILVFGGLNPKRNWSSSRPPKDTSLAETALTCQFWCRSVHWCDLGMSWRNQKRKKKARKETFAGAVFPLTLASGLSVMGN